MKLKNILKEYYSTIVIILSIIITAGLSFADQIKEKNIISILICTIIGLSIEIFFSSLKMEKNFEKTNNMIKPSTISQKVTRKEHYQKLNRAASKATSKIWIMTIDAALTSKTIKNIPERQKYYRNIERIAKKNQNISIKRIYGLPIDEQTRKDKLEWIKNDLEKIKKCPNYQIRIFDWRKFNEIPTPLSIQIIDENFVGLVNLGNASLGVDGGGEDICIKDKNIVQHLSLYYETVWSKCDILKNGEEINYKLFD